MHVRQILAAALAAGLFSLIAEAEWVRQGASFRQTNNRGVHELAAVRAGEGAVYRCEVEPGPLTERAGFRFGADGAGRGGFLLLLGGSEAGGLELRGPDGGLLWEDPYAVWVYYKAYLLEAVAAEGRVRAQVFEPGSEELLAQSEWIPVAGFEPRAEQVMTLYAEDGQARFYAPRRVSEALAALAGASPSELRLGNLANPEWMVTGGGDWRWTSEARTAIRQNKPVERSTALNAELGGGTVWRTHLRIEAGAGGAGMLVMTPKDMTAGYLIWLGGAPGNGSLIVYRNPTAGLWSSDGGKWQYGEHYVLEAEAAGGRLVARLFAGADGQLLAESPALELGHDEDRSETMAGFQTWRGAAEFWGFQKAGVPAPATAPATSGLGSEWLTKGGDWAWTNDQRTAMEQTDSDGAGAAIYAGAAQGRGRSRCLATPLTAEGVELLFQVDSNLTTGFSCLLGEGAALVTMDGRRLWNDPDFIWEAGKSYWLEGEVKTDRVAVRVLDERGRELAASGDCYVAARNNTREGRLGFRVLRGTARFADWTLQPAE